MNGLTLEVIARVTGGTLHVAAPDTAGAWRELTAQDEAFRTLAGREVASIVTDSRKAGDGSLFAAIVGARVDAHKFIPATFAQGALCALVSRDLTAEDLGPAPAGDETKAGAGVKSGGAMRAWIVTENVETALQPVAEEYLKILGIPVVGVTGSVGKTSTKEAIAAVLSQKYRVLATDGNFNNELGVPLTVFRIGPETEIAVLEMGINHFGEMTRLAKIARPDTAVITNVGYCHLEFLGDRDGVRRAKTEIFQYLKPDGQAVLNGNDDKLREITEVNGRAPIFFGLASTEKGAESLCTGREVVFPPAGGEAGKEGEAGKGNEADATRAHCAGADEIRAEGFAGTSARIHTARAHCVWADGIRTEGFAGTSARIHTAQGDLTVRIPKPGLHAVANAAAAAAVGRIYGLSDEEIARGIAAIPQVAGRFRILDGQSESGAALTLIDDCYNANPMSMRSSLAVLSETQGRRVAILGDMGELGETETELHEQTGRFAAQSTDELIAVGNLSRHLYEAALAERPDLKAVWYEDVASLLTALKESGSGLLEEGDTVLVKASHFMEFSKIVDALAKKD